MRLKSKYYIFIVLKSVFLVIVQFALLMFEFSATAFC